MFYVGHNVSGFYNNIYSYCRYTYLNGDLKTVETSCFCHLNLSTEPLNLQIKKWAYQANIVKYNYQVLIDNSITGSKECQHMFDEVLFFFLCNKQESTNTSYSDYLWIWSHFQTIPVSKVFGKVNFLCCPKGSCRTHPLHIFTYALTSYIATFHTTIPTYVAVNIAPTSISHAHSCHLSRNIKDSLALSRVPHGSLHLPQLCQKFYMFRFNATLILQLAANHYCAEIHDGVTETMDQLLQG